MRGFYLDETPDTMNIKTKIGDKVYYIFPKNGLEHDMKKCEKNLKLGEGYTVSALYVGGYRSEVTFKEVEGVSFNTVMFSNTPVAKINQKLYRVMLQKGDTPNSEVYCLRRNLDDNIRISKVAYHTYMNSRYCMLTSDEVCSLDERYMLFAEEV